MNLYSKMVINDVSSECEGVKTPFCWKWFSNLAIVVDLNECVKEVKSIIAHHMCVAESELRSNTGVLL